MRQKLASNPKMRCASRASNMSESRTCAISGLCRHCRDVVQPHDEGGDAISSGLDGDTPVEPPSRRHVDVFRGVIPCDPGADRQNCCACRGQLTDAGTAIPPRSLSTEQIAVTPKMLPTRMQSPELMPPHASISHTRCGSSFSKSFRGLDADDGNALRSGGGDLAVLLAQRRCHLDIGGVADPHAVIFDAPKARIAGGHQGFAPFGELGKTCHHAPKLWNQCSGRCDLRRSPGLPRFPRCPYPNPTGFRPAALRCRTDRQTPSRRFR